MKTYLDCIPCFFKQALFTARTAGLDEAGQKKVIDNVCKLTSDFSLELSPPQMGRMIYRLAAGIAGSDPFKGIREKSNRIALSIYPELKQKVENSKDRLLTSVELAIAGNIIDYGAKNTLDVEEEIEKILRNEFVINKAMFDYEGFRNMLGKAEKILYLADNAGEVVFDKILIEEIFSPRCNIIYAVRDKPIINDALIEDAISCGIDKYACIMSSGSDAPAAILELCSSEFIEIYENAELIISKGQGNYEALSGENKPIYFLLKAKCPVIARDIGCNVGDMLLMFSANYKKV